MATIGSMEGDAFAPVAARATQRRRNKPQQATHNVAGVVHAALAAKQRDDERALGTQTRRRNRAYRKHKRTEQHAANDATGTQVSPALALGSPAQRNVVHSGNGASFVVVVENFVDPDELEDSDEYDDVVADLEKDFRSYGSLLSLETSRETGVVTLSYVDLESARAAVREKHWKLFGGRQVVARLVLAEEEQQVHVPVAEPPSPLTPATHDAVVAPKDRDTHAESGNLQMEKKQKKKRRSRVKRAVLREREKSRSLARITVSDSVGAANRVDIPLCKFLVTNLIKSDEIEDEDELAELQSDTRTEFAAFGTLKHLEIVAESVSSVDDDFEASGTLILVAGDVVVEFDGSDYAAAAFRAYDGKIFGGRKVECRWFFPTPPFSSAINASASASHIVRVTNMLCPEELQDADEFEDLHDEVTGLFERHGAIRSLEISRESGVITVEYTSLEATQRAVAKVNQSVYGGRCVEAGVVASDLEAGDRNGAQKVELLPTEASKPDRPFAVVVRSSCYYLCSWVCDRFVHESNVAGGVVQCW